MMTFSTQNLNNVFAEEGKYDSFKKLCFNLIRGNDIYEYDENASDLVLKDKLRFEHKKNSSQYMPHRPGGDLGVLRIRKGG